MAPRTSLKQEYLASAASKFFDIASLPEPGQTGGFPNAQLRSLAYLGIAAVHIEVDEIVAENLAAAVSADVSTAKVWFGEDIIQKLLENNPDLVDISIPEQTTHPIPSQSVSTLVPQSPLTGTAKFTREQVRDAIYNKVSVSEWDLEEVNLAGLDLREVDFRKANLKKANLNDSRLGGGWKSTANLSEADLSGAQLVRAEVIDVNLRNAQLTGANFKECGPEWCGFAGSGPERC